MGEETKARALLAKGRDGLSVLSGKPGTLIAQCKFAHRTARDTNRTAYFFITIVCDPNFFWFFFASVVPPAAGLTSGAPPLSGNISLNPLRWQRQ